MVASPKHCKMRAPENQKRGPRIIVTSAKVLIQIIYMNDDLRVFFSFYNMEIYICFSLTISMRLQFGKL